MKKLITIALMITMIFHSLRLPINACELSNQELFSVKVIDAANNEEIDVNITNENINSISNMRMINTDELEVTYDVSFDLPIENNSMARNSISQEQEEASVRATFKMVYYLSSDKENIKITNFSGPWECTSSAYSMTFSNRVASVNAGQSIWADTIKKYPTSNSFSYDTGWGYVPYYPACTDALSGARGYSEATATIDGMGGSYNISVFVAVP